MALFTFRDPVKPIVSTARKLSSSSGGTGSGYQPFGQTRPKTPTPAPIPSTGSPLGKQGLVPVAKAQKERFTVGSPLGKQGMVATAVQAAKPTGKMWLSTIGPMFKTAQQKALQAQYNPNFYSQVDAYAKAMTGADKAMSALQLSSALANAQIDRASVKGQIAAINADAAAAAERLRVELAQNGDWKVYLMKKLALDQQTADLQSQALQNASNANLRQNPLLDAKRGDVEAAYQTDSATLNTQAKEAQAGYRYNQVEQQRAQGAAGILGGTGVDQDRAKIQADYDAVVEKISQDRQRLDQDRIASIRSIDEAKAVVADNQAQFGLDMQTIGRQKEGLVLDFWKQIGDIDSNEKLQKISAKQAQAQRAAAQAQANAAMARAAQAERDAQQAHMINLAGIAQQEKLLRDQAAQSGQYGIPQPNIMRPASTTNPSMASSYLPAFGLPGNPLTPNLTRVAPVSGTFANPLGIAQPEWEKILWQAGLESKGDPVRKMQLIGDYTNWFGAQMQPLSVAQQRK